MIPSQTHVLVKNARVHNLKGIDVAIEKFRLVVVTGLSGSGKSSLAFDTLYAEGQRRYVESLSSYARQFLGRMHKPEVDHISGISPAIALEQKVHSRNPRSTVGTSTEVYEYLKLLYARIGRTISPISNKQVKRDTVTDVVNHCLRLDAQSRVTLIAPMVCKHGRDCYAQLAVLLQQGFTRVVLNGKIVKVEGLLENPSEPISDGDVWLVIDRFVMGMDDPDLDTRIADSVQTAFYEGDGTCRLLIEKGEENAVVDFSNRFERDGMLFEKPTANLFAFNNPYGACKACEGFGMVIGIDPDLVIPNKRLSVYEDAIACWKGEKMKEWKDRLVAVAYRFDFPIHRPVKDLTKEEVDLLWQGNEHFKGLNDFFRMIEENTYKIQYRVMLSRYRGKTSCPDCKGTRLRGDAAYVQVGGRSIVDLVCEPLDRLLVFFEHLTLSPTETQVAKRLLVEIVGRLRYLNEVGLSYLTLNRLSNTLSGGESQRIHLATSLGSGLVGSMYILDEPSIGLHQRDTHRLIGVLKDLRDMGNTVIVVEHDEDMIRAADQVIDIGPLAGTNGGEVLFQGPLSGLLQCKDSLTAQYLRGDKKVSVIEKPRSWKEFIQLHGVRQHNLKGFSVQIPLGIMTVVSGVSGSGKSSLVNGILYPALKKALGGHAGRTGLFDGLEGDVDRVADVEYVDQNPIGKSSRSNPVTYLKAYDEIRNLFASQPLSKTRGYKAGFFSFNIEGGRCPECEGEGTVKIEMQFMADIILDCEHCKGKRFKDEILEVEFLGKNIDHVLNMTVEDATRFFAESTVFQTICHRIVLRLQPLMDVGLGYVRMGQPSSTLSGGEAQRIKLASFLSRGIQPNKTLFIFDEPTTGLHFHDIGQLLQAFNALIDNGHSLVVVEHNPEVIRAADWVIDLGPEGGEAGGHLVFEGTPDDLRNCRASYTGRFLSGETPDAS